MAAEAGCSRATAQELVLAGAVTVDGRVERRPASRVVDDAVVVVDHEPAAQERLRPDPSVVVPLVHRDEHLLVVDKPAGLVVHPGRGAREGTLVNGLLALDPAIAEVGPDPERPGIVHRLDRGTSGLMVVARTPVAHDALRSAIAAHDVEREYTTLVEGIVPEATGRVEAPLGRSPRRPTLRAVVAEGKPAATDFEVEARYSVPEPVSLLTCRLETGRTHQIRVHLAAIGHPVVGDTAYGAQPAPRLGRPFLHSGHLAFVHPVTGEPLSFRAPLPADLVAVLERLGP